MGESKLKVEMLKEMYMSYVGVDTMAGRVQVRWETESEATPMGQLASIHDLILPSRNLLKCDYCAHIVLEKIQDGGMVISPINWLP